MRVLCTGGAGFVGSHLVDRLVADGHDVVVIDDLSSGRRENIQRHIDSGAVKFVEQSVLNSGALLCAMRGVDTCFHLAANTDNLYDPEKVRADLDNGTIATWNVLEAMRANDVKRIVFASSASVYANAETPRAETDLCQLPRSPYSASKWAAEALISAWCEWFGFDAWAYRFGNVCASRIRHGVHWALTERMRQKPAALRVLGNGGAVRPFIHVSDLVDGILFGFERERSGGYHVWNLSPDDTTTVATVAAQVIAASPYPDTPIAYDGGDVGWRGDVRTVRIDPSAMARLGWRVSMTSDEASGRAAVELAREVFG